MTLMIDNSTHYLPYPFTYHPDPIITNIEPAESFVSGGRLILISGHHLAAPQSVKLMVFHEQKRNIVNATSCSTMNDTLITCLTPAISREMLATLSPTASSDSSVAANNQRMESASGFGDWMTNWNEQSTSLTTSGASQDQLNANNQQGSSLLSYEFGGVKLKIVLFMDDVKSVRNLDEYYHHLQHYITYYEDPKLFRFPRTVIDFTEELIIQGDNLKMRQLDQDTLITIGSSAFCPIKSIAPNAITCEPPKTIAPVYDDSGRLVERPLLAIVALIGSNLKFELGHMQYSAHQYQLPAPGDATAGIGGNRASYGTSTLDLQSSLSSIIGSSSAAAAASQQSGNNGISGSTLVLIALSAMGFLVGLVASLLFALNRFRQSKAEREYKRIQLQMGSLDVNGQPIGGAFPGSSIFDKIHFGSGATGIQFSSGGGGGSGCDGLNQQLQHHSHHHHQRPLVAGALDYFSGSSASGGGNNQMGAGKALAHQIGQQFNRNYSLQTGVTSANNSSFPPSPQTDISSLNHHGNLVKLTNQQGQHIYHQVAQSQHYGVGLLGGIGGGGGGSSLQSSQSSPSSSSNQNQNLNLNHQQQQQPVYETAQFQSDSSSASPVSGQGQMIGGSGHEGNQLTKRSNPKNNSTRNFNWMQEAPSTVVPYSLIEACNLTLEGKQAIREFV